MRLSISRSKVQGGGAGAGGHVTGGTALEVMEAVTPVMAATSGILSLFFEPLLTTLRTSTYFASLSHFGITVALVAASAVLAFFMVRSLILFSFILIYR
jgi:hypothetical protein